MQHIRVDLCVIGAGSGGLSLAAGAVQMGASVALVEGHKMGGDCLNFGCVPSKALISAAARAYGLSALRPPTDSDYVAAMEHVAQTIAAIAPHDSQDRFEAMGVQVIRAMGRFIAPDRIQAGDVQISARRFVIATGARAAVPPIPGLNQVPYLTNETLFDLRCRLDHLLIIGGGPIGMEMAQAHRRLGSHVTVIEGARALSREDPEMAAVVLDRLRAEGVEIVEGQPVVGVCTDDAGQIMVDLADGRSLSGSHLLLATGRVPNLESLDLGVAGVAWGKHGLTLGADLRTTNRRVYGVGDVAGPLQFTQTAAYHAGVVIRQALFALPARSKTRHIAWATYTDPELAQVGLTEAEARTQFGARLQVLRAPFSGNDRAIATGKTDGLIKVMVVRGRPVGVSIVGAGAGELIGLWALVLANGLKMSAIANTVLPYPTLSEVSKRAASAYFTPKLFESPTVKWLIRLIQRRLP